MKYLKLLYTEGFFAALLLRYEKFVQWQACDLLWRKVIKYFNLTWLWVKCKYFIDNSYRKCKPTINTKCFVLCTSTLTCLNCLIQRTLGWIPHCYSSRRLSVSFNCTDSHYTASPFIYIQCINCLSMYDASWFIKVQCITAYQRTIH